MSHTDAGRQIHIRLQRERLDLHASLIAGLVPLPRLLERARALLALAETDEIRGCPESSAPTTS